MGRYDIHYGKQCEQLALEIMKDVMVNQSAYIKSKTVADIMQKQYSNVVKVQYDYEDRLYIATKIKKETSGKKKRIRNSI